MAPRSRIATPRRRRCNPSASASAGFAFDPLARTGRVRGLTFADGAHAGPKPEGARSRFGDWTIEIIERPDAAKGFEVLLRRWAVERILARFGRSRRLARGRETSIAFAQARVFVAPGSSSPMSAA